MTPHIAHSDIFGNGQNRYKPLPPLKPSRYKRSMKLRLKELRLARGLTQTQVADLAGMSQSYYAELERGRKQVNARRLEALAGVYRVQPSDLIETSGVSSDDATAVRKFSALTESERKVVVGLMESLLAARAK